MTIVPSQSPQKPWSRWWNALPPARRKMVVTAATIAGVVVFAYLLITTQDTASPTPTHIKPDNALLPADEARDLGVSGVSLDVRKQSQNQRDLEGEVGRLKNQLERYTQASGEGQTAKDQKLQASIDNLQHQLDQIKAVQITSPPPAPGQASTPAGTPGASAATEESPAFGPIRTIGAAPDAPDASPAAASTDRKRPSAATPAANQFYLPSGSFVQAVLLTGVEAPTGQAAQRDPVPLLARIKHDAILPNFYRANVRECFVLFDAIGDLASERAMLRSEDISCVLKDKSVIDVPIQGYGVGEDGKAGLRGHVVSKQGMVLRKAMLAGFADGVSKAFGGVNGQPMLTSMPGQSVNYGQSLQSGAMGGASSALDRIAQYYLELANELHPVIEIESGRQITLVVIHGRTLATVDPAAQTSAGTAAPGTSSAVR